MKIKKIFIPTIMTFINIFWVITAICLVLLNAFFVAAEFGMVKLRHTRIEEIKKRYGIRGKILSSIHKDLDAYLSACQLGITLASLGLGWIGEPAFAVLLQPLLQFFSEFSQATITFISFFIAFAFISFLHIVLGELMPKSLAIRRSERISLWTALPLYVFYWVMYPAIFFLNGCSNFLLKKAGLDLIDRDESYYSTSEIKIILSTSHLQGELTPEETEIIERTLDFADMRVTEVMRPLDEMVAIEIHQSTQSILNFIRKNKYSRYPIYDKKKQEFIGIIHIKDLFSCLYKDNAIPSIKPFIRPLLKVSSHLPTLDLLRKFRQGMPHFALVYNSKRETAGFITLDNLLHILVGRIKDEFHRTREDWVAHKDGTFSVKGNCSVYVIERALDQDIPFNENEEENIDTVSDLVLSRLNTPHPGDIISFDNFNLIVEKIKNKETLLVKLLPKKEIKDDL